MFNNVVYLNRDEDTDRRRVTEAQMREHGISATRYPALNSTLQDRVHEPLQELRISFPQASCLVSHLEIIRLHGDRPLLVFEDDVDLSPSRYWGTSFEDIVDAVDESIGIVQMYVYPSFPPILPKWWRVGTFGTVAYFIRPWYAKQLVDTAYIDGKWEIGKLKSSYAQPVADSVLYSNTASVSLTIFGLRPVPSTILPQATYVEAAATFGQSWGQGLNNAEDIKEALKSFKRPPR